MSFLDPRMSQLSPPLITLALLLLVATYIIILVARGRTFSGYSDIRKEVQRLARIVKATPARDGDDLELKGTYGKLPVTVRFSHADNAPGLSISMEAPAGFQMSVAPRSEAASGPGKAVVRTEDRVFDAAFSVRSNQPLEARLFIGDKETLQLVKAICRSSHVVFSIAPGNLAIIQSTVPGLDLTALLTGYLDNLALLAEKLLAMPNAPRIEIAPHARRGSMTVRIVVAAALLIGMLGALGVIVNKSEDQTSPSASAGLSATTPPGMSSTDASKIVALNGWRVAEEADFDPSMVEWLRGIGIAPGGRIAGDFSGTHGEYDVAYILINKDGVMRIVLLSQGKPVLDFARRRIALAVRIPNSTLATAEWSVPMPGQPKGDALLLVTQPDASSGLVFAVDGGKILQGTVTNFKALNLF